MNPSAPSAWRAGDEDEFYAALSDLRAWFEQLEKERESLRLERDAVLYNSRADNEHLLARVEAAERERDSLMADSWRAFCEAGGDPDGDLRWHCSPEMAGRAFVDAVKSLREDYEEALREIAENRVPATYGGGERAMRLRVEPGLLIDRSETVAESKDPLD